MIHDCAISDRFVIVLDLPVTFSKGAALLGHPFPYRWNERHVARVGLLGREGRAEDIVWCPVSPCYVFHTVNAYDAEDGTVVLDVIVYDRMFSDSLVGPDSRRGGLERWLIDPATKCVTRIVIDPTLQEFPRQDERRFGSRYRYAYTIGLTGHFLGARLFKHDMATGVRQTHDFGKARHPGEFVFVPASADAAEDEGWLMGLVTDAESDTTALVILDAQDFEGSELASIHIPHRVPPGFHGNWVAKGDERPVSNNEAIENETL